MKKRLFIILFLLPVLLIFALIFLLPVLYVFIVSVSDLKLSSDSIHFVGLANFQRALGDRYFIKALSNTVIWILIQCTFHVGLGTIMALILYKKPRGWQFLRVVGMLPCMIPGAAIALIYSKIYNPSYGLLNTVLGLQEVNWLADSATVFPALTMLWFLYFGVTTQVVLSRALKIPNEILEAGKIDGASGMKLDLYITLPILKKTIGVAMILALCYMLQLFDLIFLTTNGGPGNQTLNLALYNYKVFFLENNYGYASAIAVAIIAVGAVFSLLIYRLMIYSKDGE